jgi:hypothetical protein
LKPDYTIGDVTLFVDGKKVGELKGIKMAGQYSAMTGYGLLIGRNAGTPVSRQYKAPFACATMYGVEHGGRRLYICGRYMRTDGDQCNNNSIDAEALLTFVLRAIQSQFSFAPQREALRQKLMALASAERARAKPSMESELPTIESKLRELESELSVIRRNMARESDETIYGHLRREVQVTMANIAELENSKSQLSKSESNSGSSVEDEVAAAMSLLGNIGRVASDPIARVEIREMLQRLGCRIGLAFVEAIKGKKRKVRRLTGGVIAFGNAALPVKVHGNDSIENVVTDSRSDSSDNPNDDRNTITNSGRGKRELDCGADMFASELSARPNPRHQEEISSTKVSRADWIRTSDLLVPKRLRE